MDLKVKVAALVVAALYSGGGALAMSDAMGECLLARIARPLLPSVTGGRAHRVHASEEVEAARCLPSEPSDGGVSGKARWTSAGKRTSDARDRRFVISTLPAQLFSLHTTTSDPNEIPFGRT